nr:hypothetical protein [Helicobacter pylori]
MQKIDESKLTKEQQQVLKVFKGELDQTEIKGIDLNDLYILDQGTRHTTTKKILVKQNGKARYNEKFKPRFSDHFKRSVKIPMD